MKNKYRTGTYHIALYDKHGTKQKTIYSQSYTQAVDKGNKKCSKPPYASFTVVRVLYNSLDNANPWAGI